MLDGEERTAAGRGLKRGLASAVASLALLWGLLLGLVPRVASTYPEQYPGHESALDLVWGRNPRVVTSYASSWELLAANDWWQTPLTVLVATVVAVALVTFLARLRTSASGPGRFLTSAVAYLLGAVSIALLIQTLVKVWFRLGAENGPYTPRGYGVVVPGLVVGLALAGFGARVLLRHSSLSEIRSDPSALFVDGWLAVLWLGCAVVAFEQILASGVGHWLRRGFQTDATVLFAALLALVVPVVALAVFRDVAWSVAVARSGSRAGSADVRSDGGATDAAPTRLGISSDPDGSQRLWPSVRSNRRVSVGVAMLVAAAVTVGAFLVLEWAGYPPVQSHNFRSDWHFLQYTPAVFGGAFAAAVIAIGGGLGLATALERLPGTRWVEAVAVDPFTTVLQFPVVYLAAWIVFERFGSNALTDFPSLPVFVAGLGGLALVPLVSRVVRRDRERGWSSRRIAVRATGMALCGTAVLSLWAGWILFEYGGFSAPLGLWWNRFLAFSAFALIHTAGLFLLGDGLRAVANDAES